MPWLKRDELPLETGNDESVYSQLLQRITDGETLYYIPSILVAGKVEVANVEQTEDGDTITYIGKLRNITIGDIHVADTIKDIPPGTITIGGKHD